MGDDLVGGWEVIRLDASGANIRHELGGIEAFLGRHLLEPGDLGHDHALGQAQCLGELDLKVVTARGVAARLEDGPDPALGESAAKRLEGLADGGGVMGEVVDDGDAVDFAANFHPTPDALESVEAGLNLFIAQPGVARHEQRCESVADVQLADH